MYLRDDGQQEMGQAVDVPSNTGSTIGHDDSASGYASGGGEKSPIDAATSASAARSAVVAGGSGGSP